MISNIVFYLSLIISLGIGVLYFRDLGDVSQMVVKVKRDNMLRFIRHEYKLIGTALAALAVMVFVHLAFDAGPGWLCWTALALGLFLIAFPYVWVHVGLRNQKSNAQFYSIDEAREFVSPTSPVLVIESGGQARAFPDAQIMRPHLAGNDEGLDGHNVIMTYCAMANLGIGYTPEVEGQALDLEVMAQHGNNLILRDNRTGEPIQQIYGFREADGTRTESGAACPLKPSLAMKPWPTFRMTFRGFRKAYPDGQVFLNKPSGNPLLFLFDAFTEKLFSAEIGRQHREAAPIMDNMSRHDDRLENKTYVWGIDIGDDAVCWTDDFVIEQGNIFNAQVGGRPVVIAWHPRYESLGAWFNDTGAPVTQIDFFGETPAGKLQRVDTLKPGLFWHVWAEFFPHTDINRMSKMARAA
ncbi:hypothetical protein AVO45_11830 [Ruegeria marisrubri]|uniref:DUF3179 domain-containing protein n=1 Tax=Ruegeria marisrubri TaxID=1685379 RepID=A0A0X3TL37_9RHOB|nr:DUF3179 domain-containing (seleno)protein [Ruegeria marisrubri]KUJ76475.1 hypothetical protein AVO45_11830 [Ruegeria marisrubri]